jgi:hypothetical protein
MGALSSWAMLALTHHALLQLASFRAYRRVQWNTDYLVLGDDLVIADKTLAESYLSVLDSYGIPVNLKKSFVSSSGFLQFANRNFLSEVGLSPLSLREELSITGASAKAEMVSRMVDRGWVDYYKPNSGSVSITGDTPRKKFMRILRLYFSPTWWRGLSRQLSMGEFGNVARLAVSLSLASSVKKGFKEGEVWSWFSAVRGPGLQITLSTLAPTEATAVPSGMDLSLAWRLLDGALKYLDCYVYSLSEDVATIQSIVEKTAALSSPFPHLHRGNIFPIGFAALAVARAAIRRADEARATVGVLSSRIRGILWQISFARHPGKFTTGELTARGCILVPPPCWSSYLKVSPLLKDSLLRTSAGREYVTLDRCLELNS